MTAADPPSLLPAKVQSLEIVRVAILQPLRWLACIILGCSQYGYCGSTVGYCGAGCLSGWGTCNALSSSLKPTTMSTRIPSTSTTLSTIALPTLKVTTNARCGVGFGSTCQGSQWGDCCSQYSYWYTPRAILRTPEYANTPQWSFRFFLWADMPAGLRQM